jgi:hypothetical protein
MRDHRESVLPAAEPRIIQVLDNMPAASFSGNAIGSPEQCVPASSLHSELAHQDESPQPTNTVMHQVCIHSGPRRP